LSSSDGIFPMPGSLYQWTKSECVCWNVEVINFVYAPNIEELFFIQLVFSSSATVYGQPKSVPCTEDFPLQAMNPYGRTKVRRIVNFAHDLVCTTSFWSSLRVCDFHADDSAL
jgi:hypothetical protein